MSKRILGLFGVTTLAAVLGLVVYPAYTAHKRRKTSESFTFHAKEELPEEEVATATPTEEISDVSPSAHFLPSIPSSVLSDKTNTTPPSPPKVAKKRYDPSKAALNKSRKKIHFAAGCFWSVELVFQRVVGVYSTKVGYTQGKVDNPTYEDVKTGKSGHAEAVEVVYDTSLVTLEQLMDVFWGKHDATKKNMAGNDKGTQYRSGVYFFTKEQKAVVAASVEGQRSKLSRPWLKIHTEIKPASAFYAAENYHQKYLSEKGGRHGKAQSAIKGCTDPIRCYG